MMIRIGFVMEILATIVCLHCIYGIRFRLNIKTMGLILGIMVVLESVNYFQLSGTWSFLGYLFLCIYCKYEFKSSNINVVISFVLCMIVLTVIQFVYMFLANVIGVYEMGIRNVVCNSLTLLSFIVFSPVAWLNKLQQSMCKKKIVFMLILLGFMGSVAIIILLQGKTFYAVQMQYFIFVIPAIIFLLYVILKWYKAQTEVEKLEKEIRLNEKTTSGYEDLLIKVRLRQHEFKNHIAAIFSAHYTHKTYESLVLAQEEYCKKLMDENKYNSLLVLGNNILVGYLYEKFQEAEADLIDINYKVTTSIEQCQVPLYNIIEMLGILLDNATEALKNSDKKIISFEVCEVERGYLFTIKNPFQYVSYDKILEWFRLDVSEKGENRGLGLYHLKCLCEKWECDVGCRNEEIEHINWIVFTLKIGKADSV